MGRLLNLDEVIKSMDTLGLWRGGTSGTKRLRNAGSLNHVQLCFPVIGNWRTEKFCVADALAGADDQFSDMLPHFEVRGGAAQQTLLESLQDLCDAPFELPADWCPLHAPGCGEEGGKPWLVTGCGPQALGVQKFGRLRVAAAPNTRRVRHIRPRCQLALGSKLLARARG